MCGKWNYTFKIDATIYIYFYLQTFPTSGHLVVCATLTAVTGLTFPPRE